MNISIRDAGQMTIVDVKGDVDLGTSQDLRRTLFDAEPLGATVAVNLEAVHYIDSSGIATLIEALKHFQRLHKEFMLFGLSPAVEAVFRLTHVAGIFRIFHTELEALGGR